MHQSGLVEAYETERDAVVPMIALTDNLYEHLSNHSHRQFYASSDDPLPQLIRHLDNLPTGKDIRFIDYVPVCLETLYGEIIGEEREIYSSTDSETRKKMRNDAYWRACHRWALLHGNSIRKQYNAADDDIIREKYSWLAYYHNDAPDRFYNGAVPSGLLIGDL